MTNPTSLPRQHRLATAVVIVAMSTFTASIDAREPSFSTIDQNGNKNGVIEPQEIPNRDYTIVARYASLAGLDVSQPMPIRSLEQGREKYYRSLDRANEPGNVWEKPAKDREFGRMKGTNVRLFGDAGGIAEQYSSNAWNSALGTFRNFDANRDGLLSQEEVRASAYKSAIHSWFRGDRNNDGMLTFMEMAVYFTAYHERRNIRRVHEQSTWNIDGTEVTVAHRRHAAWLMGKLDKNKNGVLEGDEIPDSWRTGNGLSWADGNDDGRVTTLEMQVGAVRFLKENAMAAERRNNTDLSHANNLANDMIRRYDTNKDRSLSSYEWRLIPGDASPADLNENGLIQVEELSRWLLTQMTLQKQTGQSDGLPVWFVELDIDLDGQVLLAEFLQSRSSSPVTDFHRYDQNSDGIVTADEGRAYSTAGKSKYSNRNPVVLEAESEASSEIFIPDDILIVDIDVNIAITKAGDDDVELLLTGPDGTTAWLYYTSRRKPWSGGRLFEDTIIDEEAPEIKQRLPRPPALRSFRPQGMDDKTLPSLSAFYGQSARGTWTLTVRNKGQNRGKSAGLLQGWTLLVHPK